MSTYGQRGGIGPHTGRRAEVIVSACGQYRKRVFNGQRWLVVTQRGETDAEHVMAFGDEAECERQVGLSHRFGEMVHFYVPAAPCA